MIATIGRNFMRLTTLPTLLLIGLPAVLFLWVTRFGHSFKIISPLTIIGVKKGSNRRYSTTLLSPVLMMKETATMSTMAHELVHVRQLEDMALSHLLLGSVLLLSGAPWWSLVVCLLWTAPGFLSSYLAAFIRRDHYYYDAEVERSARAQQHVFESKEARHDRIYSASN